MLFPFTFPHFLWPALSSPHQQDNHEKYSHANGYWIEF
uniref:Uncharacterized protein n=1 Tax=Rhizophora mucronata TaxID=61149 RepID=A0A2P2N1M6_RHIMU